MKAVVVTCPHCGARLQVAGTLMTVQCEYCGTASRVQRRTMMLERVVPPPQAGPRPVAIQVHTRGWKWGIVVVALLPVAITAFVVYQVQRTVSRVMDFGAAVATSVRTEASTPSRSSSSSSSSDAPDAPEWQGTQGVILVDVDGNGTLDIVGRSRRVRARDVVRVIALDGATGAPLWESEPLGTYSETYQGVLALAKDRIVFASPRAELTALELATGKLAWLTKLDERVARFCDGGADTVLAVGTDHVVRPLRRADGTPSGDQAAPRRPRRAPACPTLPDDGRALDGRNPSLARKHGLARAEVLAVPAGRVLAGTRAQGTRTPTLVALDARGVERWRSPIPPDPLAALERDPLAAAASDREVCAAYYGESITKPPHLACFTLADGARLWDLAAGDRSLRGLRVIGRALVMFSSGAVEAYDLERGTLRWRFGR